MAKLPGGQKVVLDTNILVSALLSNGPPALILDWIAEGKLLPLYTEPILAEYVDVLNRPKFGFSPLQIDRLIQDIVRSGFSVDAGIPGSITLPDESDRKFYDAAKAGKAVLITGNSRHYPQETFIVTPGAFVDRAKNEIV
jgi:putative PIN family toxin of toxin-antitoxin system